MRRADRSGPARRTCSRPLAGASNAEGAAELLLVTAREPQDPEGPGARTTTHNPAPSRQAAPASCLHHAPEARPSHAVPPLPFCLPASPLRQKQEQYFGAEFTAGYMDGVMFDVTADTPVRAPVA